MARWAPNSRDRLLDAAAELFLRSGYANVTALEITERAGLSKATFFRHFPDKREVLFAHHEAVVTAIGAAIAQAPREATPLELVGLALDALAVVFDAERRPFAALRRTVIEQDLGLQERRVYKESLQAAAIVDGLLAREVPPPVAQLAGALGGAALVQAHHHWLESEVDWIVVAHDVLAGLVAAARILD
ncbi:TetR/AcrR family transcriptional regulator [Pseudonocardiaceae bacterium YIM PH 21723]|nr:TetR/AcrR family transcriptional regulator [Pseudonocardiaceae bacterium YIM PH 21723]